MSINTIAPKRSAVSALIERSGKSLSRLSRESGLSLAHISRVKDGLRTPSLDVIRRLSRVLDTNEGELTAALFSDMADRAPALSESDGGANHQHHQPDHPHMRKAA